MAVNQDVIINKLIEKGVIARTAVRGKYTVTNRNGLFKRAQILSEFAIEVQPWRYRLNENAIAAVLRPAVLRTISRSGYHSVNREQMVANALAAIPADADGVVRSFGLEYEVYSLTAEQEDKLARLLDTMPAHITERDGSLGNGGVEIVFAPVGADKYIEIVNTLKQFVIENHVVMESAFGMAGMHTTYGVSNPEASKSDLQVRLNRFALALKSVATVSQIKGLFGRDFGNYRELPRSNNYTSHVNAFSTNGRPATCWECRLPSWSCNPEGLVKFFKVTESAFHRPFTIQDLTNMYQIIGGGHDGQ